MSSKTSLSVIVTGDITIDWNLARSRNLQGGGTMWNVDDCTRAYPQPGGAALLGTLIKSVAGNLNSTGGTNIVVETPRHPDVLEPGDGNFHHSYAMWSPHDNKKNDKTANTWRIEEYLGLHKRPQTAGAQPVDNFPPDAKIVVLDDANLGFRDDETRWPKAIFNNPAWTVVKMSKPVGQGDLWKRLIDKCKEQLIVVLTINDLRLSNVQISRGLSWERTCQDLVWELNFNPGVTELSQAAHVVVSCGPSGAVLSSPTQNGPEWKLIFDPESIEDSWEQQYPGGMMGHTVSLTSAIVRELMTDAPDIERGVKRGLAAMRLLQINGYETRNASVENADLKFPCCRILEAFDKNGDEFKIANIPAPVQARQTPASPNTRYDYWTILHDQTLESLDNLAERIVKSGVKKALNDLPIPVGRFGKLTTVDRQEIEAFRSIGMLIAEYDRQKPKRPLSIGVFGAPGAGKSFGVEEVANSLSLKSPVKVLQFNLSQFTRPEDLLEALHQVRDVGLSGNVPLVFWDEFDTTFQNQRLGWLRYFLAPMQDGKFQQGQITHPIGRAIFVFAGGTATSMEEFARTKPQSSATPDETEEERELTKEEFKQAKGPDFVSRLKGFVNILGPNRKEGSLDPFFIIRRAILLRSILERDAQRLFKDGDLQADPGLIQSLLRTSVYKHGVRSMESIIAMSTLAHKGTFERSALPAEAQLNLHLDAYEFITLLSWTGDILEQMAEVAYDVYSKHAKQSKQPYAKLENDEKESNRATVRDIPYKLTLAGYRAVPMRQNESPFKFSPDDLERLSKMEHQRWTKEKIEAGWRYGATRDEDEKTHPDLLLWQINDTEKNPYPLTELEKEALGDSELSETAKEKDRELVKAIPQILERAGYTIRKAEK